MKTSGRKKKLPPTIQIGTKLTDVLSGRLLPQKYNYPSSHVITLNIGGIEINNVLIDFVAAINVITSNTVEMLGMTKVQPTKTILQLVDQSTAKPRGVLEDIMVTIDTWDYLVDFLVLKARKKDSSYPIILGRPWLDTVATLIDCRSGSMIISNG